VKWILFLLGMGGIVGLGLFIDSARLHAKRARIANRQKMTIDELYDTYYSATQISKDKVVYYWGVIASLLRLDPQKLRPTDRFAVELAPVNGKELSDEIEDVAQFLVDESKEKGFSFSPEKVKTMDDAIKLLTTQKS
jgi:hypothetical protein